MPAERRGQAIAFEIGSTGDGRNPMFNGRRQPSCGGTSRMMREYQVRICERLGVKFPGSTRPRLLIPPASRFAIAVTIPAQGDLVLEMPERGGGAKTITEAACFTPTMERTILQPCSG